MTSTTNDITIRQNQPEFLELLKAQRRAYTESKRFLLFDILTPIFALVLPLLLIYDPQFEFCFGVLSAAVTVLYMFFVFFRAKKNELGAKIQEEFDTTLFNLTWNEKNVGYKTRLEIKNALAKKDKGKKLTGWYSHEIKPFLPHKIAVLLCQRINLAWEADLKKNYNRSWIIFAVTYYVTMFTLFLCFDVSFRKAVLIFLPSIPFLIYVVQLNYSVGKQITIKEDTLNRVDKCLGKHTVDKPNIPSVAFLSEIQDSIFNNRKESERIPNFYYDLKREKYQTDMHKTIKIIVDNFGKIM